jgi:hypothetical protein
MKMEEMETKIREGWKHWTISQVIPNFAAKSDQVQIQINLLFSSTNNL